MCSVGSTVGKAFKCLIVNLSGSKGQNLWKVESKRLLSLSVTMCAVIGQFGGPYPCRILLSHKNYNFLACDWFKKVLFSTNSLAKLLSDSLISDSLISQSHSTM